MEYDEKRMIDWIVAWAVIATLALIGVMIYSIHVAARYQELFDQQSEMIRRLLIE